MEEQDVFMMLDEFGNEKEARILNAIEIDGKEYVVYAISKNAEEDNIFASRIIKDQNGEEQIVPIVDLEEKRMVSDVINNVIDDLE